MISLSGYDGINHVEKVFTARRYAMLSARSLLSPGVRPSVRYVGVLYPDV